MKTIFAVLIFLLVVSLAQPAMAEDTSMRQYAGVVLGLATTDRRAPGAPGGQMPNYWLPPSPGLFPKNGQRVIVITTLDPGFGESVFSAMTALGRTRGIVVLKNAKSRNGDLVFTVNPALGTGHSWQNDYDSHSGNDSWSRGNRGVSSGNSGSDNYSSRNTKVSLRARSSVVQIVDGEEAGAFSPEEFGPTAVIKSAQTSGSSYSAHSDYYSSNRRNQRYSSSSSSRSSTSYGSDEGFEQENMKEVARDERGPELVTKFFWSYLKWLQETGRIVVKSDPTPAPVKNPAPNGAGVPAQTVP